VSPNEFIATSRIASRLVRIVRDDQAIDILARDRGPGDQRVAEELQEAAPVVAPEQHDRKGSA